VFGHVGIDGFAGPSDLMLIADGGDPDALALDLLAQAEHGAGSIVIAISDSGELLDGLAQRIEDAADGDQEQQAVMRLVAVHELDQALAIAEAFAPEHLQLSGEAAERLAPRVRHAGCVLVGADSGTAFSDYIAGSNHVLPTNAAARFASALSPVHFRRRISQVRIGSGAAELARVAAPLARAEGFELHARSMEARVRQNDG
jgi:histidinol dehydrogenase